MRVMHITNLRIEPLPYKKYFTFFKAYTYNLPTKFCLISLSSSCILALKNSNTVNFIIIWEFIFFFCTRELKLNYVNAFNHHLCSDIFLHISHNSTLIESKLIETVNPFMLYNLQMAQGMQCLHAISNYMRKVELKYQHVFGHNYTTMQQFKESCDKKLST